MTRKPHQFRKQNQCKDGQNPSQKSKSPGVPDPLVSRRE